jgi:hypothetical protein
MAFLCVSIKTFWGKSMSNTFHKKVEVEKKLFSCRFFPSIFYRVFFWAVSLHEELKNTTQIFSKIRPENLKKSQKR